MPTGLRSFLRQRALDLIWVRARIVILAGGTGNPYFTTDTTAVLRAAETRLQRRAQGHQCRRGLQCRSRNGQIGYPLRSAEALQEAMERNLKVMDTTAFALARENAMPIIVFSIREPGAIEAVLRGKGRATIVAK